MREIKFKQPIWENGRFVGWHYWGFKNGLYQHPINIHESYQWTGLKDKNGKEIYEGDIVKLNLDRVGRIVYQEGQYEIVVKYDTYHSSVYHSDWKSLEVIGNIYENPELLETRRE